LDRNLKVISSKLKSSSGRNNRLAFSILQKVKTQRRKKPTSNAISHMTRSVRRSQTFHACSVIHGVNSDLGPLIDGMLDTLTSKIKSKNLARSILKCKPSLVKEIEKEILLKWKNEYNKSNENMLRSLNIYYSHNVMGKAKYRAIRKANKNSQMPNFVPYAELATFINKIDIGTIYDVQKHYGSESNDEPIDGYVDHYHSMLYVLSNFICVLMNIEKTNYYIFKGQKIQTLYFF